ncbi:MAG: 3-deoxy-manno-octulosonate cytidylyltransferase [Flavobacteriaceae bacterium]|nr:3-deoxy-manno-octulosonate cytidylyltransferase [Flavobacteriaceae bacterium]
MKNIKVLDCTLRDGGYINDWSFTNRQIKKIMTSLQKSHMDIIECGYLNDKKGKESDSTLFDTVATIDKLLNLQNIKAQKVVMINLGDFDIINLPGKTITAIDGIRLAFHKKDMDLALETSSKIIDLGYKVYFQPMVTKNYNDIEFLSLIDKANQLDIYSFYIVDSFGSMTLAEFQRYMILTDNNLNKSISLGYHSHNNMQLAFSNAITMCNSNLNRDLIIDASIYGIGRGAGNLNTELITDYLNNTFNKRYETLPLLEIIDDFFSFLMKKKSWGFSPAQYLSASFNCHPNYATYLINKNTNHIVGVRKVLEKLSDKNKSSFDKELIEKLYIKSLLETKTAIKGTLNIPSNKKVLLVASGKSVEEYKEMINKKLNDASYVLIALNHKPSFECDYYFFSNQKRYDEFKNILSIEKIVITSNILSSLDLNIVLDIKPLVFIENKFIINVAIVAINYLILKNISKVEVVGLDGYKVNVNNYNYKETSVVLDDIALLEQNKFLSNALVLLEKKIVIELLTPSVFKKDIKLRILGVIPARYESSRFEGKPLCLINNIPMIKRTYTQALKSNLLSNLVVATDNETIEEYCQQENIPVVMTSKNCLTGTDRLAEVASREHYDLYVNIQGDEPVIDPISIDEIVVEFTKYQDKYMAYNLYKIIDVKDEIESDTIIKTIVNEFDELMYMSRLSVPFNKSKNKPIFKKQVCVYGFTKKALQLFSSRDKTLNEQFEDIEILRFLDMGYKVKMRETTVDSIAVDVVSDIQKVEEFLNLKGLN